MASNINSPESSEETRSTSVDSSSNCYSLDSAEQILWQDQAALYQFWIDYVHQLYLTWQEKEKY